MPDPLVLADGTPVADAATWRTRRRAEILRLFETQVYGQAPGRPSGLAFVPLERADDALEGRAIRKQTEARNPKRDQQQRSSFRIPCL